MTLKERVYNGSKDTKETVLEQKNRALARRVAAESFVLLKNEKQTLPLAKNAKVALYGSGIRHTIKGGTGSGDVGERYCVTIYDGLKNNGMEITTDAWLDSYDEIYQNARLTWRDEVNQKRKLYDDNFFKAYSSTQFRMPAGEMLDREKAESDGADVAIVAISRVAGENADRHDELGDYYISEGEFALIRDVCEVYERVVLVINTGGLIDLAFTEAFENITSIVQFMQAGEEGGNALYDVLVGDVNFSGKMTDTWALTYDDYPNADTFSYKSGDVFSEAYVEGIYVGYRYFDTFDVPVRYSFGHGLSYTTFAIRTGEIKAQNDRVSVDVCVTNTGDVAGKEVVQIYASCPQGALLKEYRRLVAFAKTKLLAPGEDMKMTISFPLDGLTSYDEAQNAYILEDGLYGIWAGNSLANANICGALSLAQTIVKTQCESVCPLKEALEEIEPDIESLLAKQDVWQTFVREQGLPIVALEKEEIHTETIVYDDMISKEDGAIRKMVDGFSREQLISFAMGVVCDGQNDVGAAVTVVPGAAAETSYKAQCEPWNVASIVMADGPAGVRIRRDYEVIDGTVPVGQFLETIENGFFAPKKEWKGEIYHQYCTAFPVGTLLAQSFDVGLIKEVGRAIGEEMDAYNITLWLAPGINIHRNPLCGRNFEYYSEDPVMTGLVASAITMGVQSVPGCGTTIKHYACNNQEDNRMGSDSIVSQRAIREIYTKAFEITIKDAQPMSIMTSYNMINGIHAANSRDLCVKLTRDEWGFAGAIMTDWDTTVNSTAGECTAAGCLRAGNDMIMPGSSKDVKNLQEELDAQTLDMETVKQCVCNTIQLCLASNRYEEAKPYSEQFEGLDSYIVVTE